MEHYPDIQRRDGTLFFVLPETTPRAAIATSIERLIDLLDAFEDDPDVEDGGDLEPTHGWPNAGQPINEAMCCDDEREQDNTDWEPNLGAAERHPHPSGYSYGDQKQNHTQALWSAGAADDREDDGDDLEPSLLSAEYRNGRVEVDLEGDGSDNEYSHGWTDHIDQNKALMGCGGECAGEGEPELGFAGIATGWREGEDTQDSEACQLGGSELEWDFAESGVADLDALHDIDHCSFLTAAQAGLVYDGSGAATAEKLLKRAMPRIKPYSRIIGTRKHTLHDSSVFTTLVPH